AAVAELISPSREAVRTRDRLPSAAAAAGPRAASATAAAAAATRSQDRRPGMRRVYGPAEAFPGIVRPVPDRPRLPSGSAAMPAGFQPYRLAKRPGAGRTGRPGQVAKQ